MRNNLVLLKILLPTVFIVVGLILFAAALTASHVSANKKKTCTAKTYGIVCKIEIRQSVNSGISSNIPSTMWFPIYEYTVNGKTMRTRSAIGYSKKIFQEGQSVALYYAPENPGKIYVPDAQVPWAFILLYGMGFVFFFFGIAVYVLFRWFWQI